MQVTTIKTRTKYKEINISAIYCPPRHNLKRDDYEELFNTMGGCFIIGGDFNAKNTYWGSRVTTPKGRELFEAGKKLKCDFQSGGSPTYWPTDLNKTPDLIDFYVTKGISDNYIRLENNEELTSDHSPVIMTVSETIIEKEITARLSNKNTNWKIFRELLEQNINLQAPIRNIIQVEEEVERLIENIQQAAWQSTSFKYANNNNCKNYPLEVRELVAKKRKARKSWQINRTKENKTVLNNLCNKLKSLIRTVKNESISTYLSSLTSQKDTEYSLWKATKVLKRPTNSTAPIRSEDGSWARSAKQKADLFARHLEETFQPLPRQTADENVNLLKRSDELEIQSVSLQELKEEIQNLNMKKSPGYDLITGQIIKELPNKAIRKLLHIINAVFRLRYVPRQWKVAEVIMILKPNKQCNDKKSFRPISILPTIAKIFEKLLLKRMKPIMVDRNLIPDHQFGFRENHSTIEQVHRITDIIERTLETKKICSSVFLDVAQAFDRVWHRGLEFKLKRDLPKQYYETLKSYITDRHFRVKYEDEYSDLKKISAGVPQGSVLGPVLYLLYTRDIPPMEEATIATYADDTAILAVGNNVEEATNKLQKSTNSVNNWMKQWRIKLNETKSVHVNFTNKNISNRIPIIINSKQVAYADTAKYLGMTLDAKLRWKEHVKKKKEELNMKYRKMYWLLGRHSELSIHNKLLLYRQILKPVWTYGIQLWGCTKKTNIKMIQTFQNKVLRNIVNAPWYIRNEDLHRDLKMEYIDEVITYHALKHDSRLRQHENIEICNMRDRPLAVRRLQRTKPIDLVNGT